MASIITYTAVLDVHRATAEHLAKLLRGHRERLGTRNRTRALSVFKQAVLVLRWFVDHPRIPQLARNNGISLPTAYRYLHEGLTVLADHAPDLSTALEGAAVPGYTPPQPGRHRDPHRPRGRRRPQRRRPCGWSGKHRLTG